MGTANVFAREAGLPFSPERVAHTLLYGTVRAIPVGQINDRPFLFVVGIGFDAEAVAHFETSGTRQLGQLGLIGPVLRALLSHRDVALRVTTDGGRKEAQWVIVTRVQRALCRRSAPEPECRYCPNKVLRGEIWRKRQIGAITSTRGARLRPRQL